MDKKFCTTTGYGNTILTDQFEGRSPTPALERRKYFKIIINHNVEVDPIGVIQYEAAAIEFSGVNG
jgi:hypothetical protein